MKNGNTEAKRNRAREKERKSVKVYIANNIDERAEKYRSSIILPWPLPRLFPDRFLPFLYSIWDRDTTTERHTVSKSSTSLCQSPKTATRRIDSPVGHVGMENCAKVFSFPLFRFLSPSSYVSLQRGHYLRTKEGFDVQVKAWGSLLLAWERRIRHKDKSMKTFPLLDRKSKDKSVRIFLLHKRERERVQCKDKRVNFFPYSMRKGLM